MNDPMNPNLPYAPRVCLGLAVLALLAASACRGPVYTVSTAGPDYPFLFHDHRVVQNGQVITTFQPGRMSQFEVTGDKHATPDQTLKSLSVQASTPCGWRADSFNFAPHRDQDSVYYLNVTEPDEGWHHLSVFVDNRGGGQVRVAVGALEQNVDAGHYADLDFAFAQVCPEADQLKLNGQVIASVRQLESTRKDKSVMAHILIDTTASHCYTYESAQYGGWDPEGPLHRVEKLPAARVQTFEGNLNYYFTELPEQIKVSNIVMFATQGTIKDRSCTM